MNRLPDTLVRALGGVSAVLLCLTLGSLALREILITAITWRF